MSRDIWYTEEQLGDLLWEDKETSFCDWDNEALFFREFKIGSGRVDFAVFSKNSGGPLIHLYELKITVTVDSIIQILKYKSDLEELLRQMYFESTERNFKKCPKVSMNLYGRYIDVRVIELCHASDIGLFRFSPNNGNVLESLLDYELPVVPEDPALDLQITNFFGGSTK